MFYYLLSGDRFSVFVRPLNVKLPILINDVNFARANRATDSQSARRERDNDTRRIFRAVPSKRWIKNLIKIVTVDSELFRY